MPLTTCAECTGTVSTAATACPHCGFRTSPQLMASEPAVIVARAVLALLCAAFVFVFPGAIWLAVVPAALLGASFWKPAIATYGLAVLVALFVLASILDPGPS